MQASALRRLVAGALLAGLVASWLAACGGSAAWPPTRPAKASQLAARPEGKLLYPNAVVIRRYQGDEHGFPMEEVPAVLDMTFTTQVDATAVLAWYRAQLQSRGFTLVEETDVALSMRRGGGEQYSVGVSQDASGSPVYTSSYQVEGS